MKKIVLGLCLTVFSVIACGCSAKEYPPLKTPEKIELQDFLGKWTVIANIPYFAEKNKVATYTEYRINPDKDYFDDIYSYQDGGFDAKVEQLKGKVVNLDQSYTQWQSTFYRVLKSKFSVLYLDPNQQILLIGHESRKYGWIMAKTDSISDQQYQDALSVFVENAYQSDQFQKVPRQASDIGKPGYQTIK